MRRKFQRPISMLLCMFILLGCLMIPGAESKAYASSAAIAATPEELTNALVGNFSSMGTSFTVTYTGEFTDLSQLINDAVNNALSADTDYFRVGSCGYGVSGTTGNLTIEFTFAYAEEPVIVDGISTIEEMKSKLVEGLLAKAESITITYTGEVTDLSNRLSTLVSATLSESPNSRLRILHRTG